MKFFFFIILFSCTTQTKISSLDGVKIYIDGDFKARGSYLHRDNKIIFSDTRITLGLEGCNDVNYVIEKDEKINSQSLMMSFLLLPLLWLYKYDELHHYDFVCSKG